MNSEFKKTGRVPPKPKTPKPDQPQTAILSSRNLIRPASGPGAADDDMPLSDNRHEVILVIRGMVERLLLGENQPVILGRTDLSTRFHPDVDMTPYGAVERGVSRQHASLHMQGTRLYVTDLGSTNGTFISGKRLPPQKAELLRKGDELLLGRLTVQVLFK